MGGQREKSQPRSSTATALQPISWLARRVRYRRDLHFIWAYHKMNYVLESTNDCESKFEFVGCELTPTEAERALFDQLQCVVDSEPELGAEPGPL
jgi:hypothetical protein